MMFKPLEAGAQLRHMLSRGKRLAQARALSWGTRALMVQTKMTAKLTGNGVVYRGDVGADQLGTPYRPLTWTSADGIKLAGRDYGDPASRHLPLVCMAGLTRNGRDFEPVAAHLVPLGGRVITLDSRGRGASDWDPNPANYTPMTELMDAFTALDGLGLQQVAALGTSRGGILMMLGALARPGFFQRSILNDIGPRIELDGLLKIKGHVGRDLVALTWGKAVFSLSVGQGRNYPRLDDAGWHRFARRIWRDVNGRPVPDYDPALALGMTALTEDTRMPESWEGFAELAKHPVLVLRGGLSDILSEETAREMVRRHPATVTAVEVPDEAHVPLLEDDATLDRITQFLMG